MKARLVAWCAMRAVAIGWWLVQWAVRRGVQVGPGVTNCYVQKRDARREYFVPGPQGMVVADLDRFVVIPRETMQSPGRRQSVVLDLAFPSANGVPLLGASRSDPAAQAYADTLARLALEERKALTALDKAMPQRAAIADGNLLALVDGGKHGVKRIGSFPVGGNGAPAPQGGSGTASGAVSRWTR